MARTRYRMVRDPKTGTYSYQATSTPTTASLFQELENIKTAAARPGKITKLPSAATDGAKRVYTSTQLQTLKDIGAAKEGGADVRQFRTTDPKTGVTAEQAGLLGAIDLGTGFIDLTDASRLAASEKKLQPELEKIRATRAKATALQSKQMRRTTGRRALLQSPTGGRGFFGGYFK